MVDAYPLAWPLGRARTPASKRQISRFSNGGRPVSVAVGTKRVLAELDAYTRAGRTYRVPPSTIVISTNIELRRDGLPYSNRRDPVDPGVAVYFTLDKAAICLPCDAWSTVGGNLAAVAAHIAALRGIERWGVGTTADHYSGFLALPAAGEASGRAWWSVLDVAPDADEADIQFAFRAKAHAAHPDTGGSHEAWLELMDARRQGLAAAKR